MKTLFLIPARGGSKGIPGKNIKKLGTKPLIQYSIDCAREITTDDNICVSTDDLEIIKVIENLGLKVPFIRPDYLATDTASSDLVIRHALKFYESNNVYYDAVVLLQPTSPFRKPWHIKNALKIYEPGLDMVVSVKETSANPYFSLFEEDNSGYLLMSKKSNFKRRQDCPNVYEFNGALYIISSDSIKEKSISDFKKIRKYIMEEVYSVDIDSPIDWEFCEFLLSKAVLIENP